VAILLDNAILEKEPELMEKGNWGGRGVQGWKVDFVSGQKELVAGREQRVLCFKSQ
jgi:hypothetical protein